ncbi:MAG TPA: phage holin family protein [Anaerolineae bacterium]|jgi:putative membrane protein
MTHFLIRLVINAVALGVAALLLPGIRFGGEGDVGSLINILIVALIFGLVNAVIKPVLALLTCPFYIVTLGLFTFVVNALMLMLTAWLVGPRFVVDGFWTALFGSIIISLVSTVISASLKENQTHVYVE